MRQGRTRFGGQKSNGVYWSEVFPALSEAYLYTATSGNVILRI